MTFFSNHSPSFSLLCQSSMWWRGVPRTVLATIFFGGQATNMVAVLSPTTIPLSPKFQFSSSCMATTVEMQQMAATVTTPMATTAVSQQPLSLLLLFFIFIPLAPSWLCFSFILLSVCLGHQHSQLSDCLVDLHFIRLASVSSLHTTTYPHMPSYNHLWCWESIDIYIMVDIKVSPNFQHIVWCPCRINFTLDECWQVSILHYVTHAHYSSISMMVMGRPWNLVHPNNQLWVTQRCEPLNVC